ncbi:hypothetical protein PV327_009562 [Microctonus hyperodae]|uniref:Methionyl-tRNA formyltransferase, mitochondrial n=1 Tax=Microctonus hyperodae TaxID=165561 RepID=A0AA39CBA1_MICHY|nr:hypothetical protein PV327_009562 [Microctonus hyperodae]
MNAAFNSPLSEVMKIIINKKQHYNIFKTSVIWYNKPQFRHFKTKWSILFFGADKFAVESLQQIHKHMNLWSRLEVVTPYNTSKPNDITLYTKKHKIKLHPWPITFPISQFDIGLVVSFGHLIPTWIIQSFPLGMINVHASLLPRWRGAAPIIHSLLHGDTTTGVTIIKIMPKNFDTGEILAQTSVDIHPDETQIQLYSKLANVGAGLLIESIERLPNIIQCGIPQNNEFVTYAPKITRNISYIHWDKMTAANIYNLYRALDGLYQLTTYFNGHKIKLFNIKYHGKQDYIKSSVIIPGLVFYDKKNDLLAIQCLDGLYISAKQISVSQHSTMTAKDFHNGFIANITKQHVIFTSQ